MPSGSSSGEVERVEMTHGEMSLFKSGDMSETQTACSMPFQYNFCDLSWMILMFEMHLLVVNLAEQHHLS